MTKDEMAEWHHRLNAHEFEQAHDDGEGQGSLVSCSPWGLKGLDTTEQLNTSNNLLERSLCTYTAPWFLWLPARRHPLIAWLW